MAGIFDRARNLFQHATRPAPEPGLVDHAAAGANRFGGRIYAWVNEQSPWAARRIDEAADTLAQMDRRGYGEHFEAFNESLKRPLTNGFSSVMNEAKAAATCAPASDPTAHFVLWNILCFWLGIALVLVELVLPFR